MASKGAKRKRTPSQWRQNVHFSLTANQWDPVILKASLNGLKESKLYFIKGQLEEGGRTARPHIQSYFYQQEPKSLAATQKWVNSFFGCNNCEVTPINSRAHFDNVYPYVHKDTHTDECGRTSVGHIDTRFEVGCELPGFLLTGVVEEKESSLDEDISTRTRIIWCIGGDPGTGKSTLSKTICRLIGEYLDGYDARTHVVGSATLRHRWLGDYKNQPTCYIPEFHPSQFNDDFLKTMLDRAPDQLTTTGGGASAMFNAWFIIVHTNMGRKELEAWLEPVVTNKQGQKLANPFFTRIDWCVYLKFPTPPHWKLKKCMFSNMVDSDEEEKKNKNKKPSPPDSKKLKVSPPVQYPVGSANSVAAFPQ